jgi:hypothetical protein
LEVFINFAYMKAAEIPKIVTQEGDPMSDQDENHFKLVAEIKDYIHEGSIKFETSLVSDAGDPQFRSMEDSIEFKSESKQHPDLSGKKMRTRKA